MKSTQTNNTIKTIIAAMILMACASASNTWAHGRYYGPRVSIGLGVGFGSYAYPFPVGYARRYYPAPYYPYQTSYYPEVIVETLVSPTPATVYVREANITQNFPIRPSTSVNGSDWYYCHNPDGFYPSIKTCPSGWQKVPAQVLGDK